MKPLPFDMTPLARSLSLAPATRTDLGRRDAADLVAPDVATTELAVPELAPTSFEFPAPDASANRETPGSEIPSIDSEAALPREEESSSRESEAKESDDEAPMSPASDPQPEAEESSQTVSEPTVSRSGRRKTDRSARTSRPDA